MLPVSKVLEKIKPREEERELFLALVIGGQKVKSGIWLYKDGKGEILSIGSSENWTGDSEEELIVAADASISTAIAGLPEITDRQPTKVILGLPEHWLDGVNIKTEKTKVLQTVCRKLLLTPQGYVIIPEGIAQFLKKEEGDLVSVILVNLEREKITVSLIIRGKYLGSKVVERSSSLVLDLEEGLLRFGFEEVLPPRILLVGEENLDTARQTLVAYPWINAEKQKKLPFLQLPRVDLAKNDLEIAGLVYSGSIDIKPQKVFLEKDEKIETVIEKEPKEDFGFVQNFDIVLQQNENSVVGEEKPVEIVDRASQIDFLKTPRLFKLNFGFLAKGIKSFFGFFSIFRFGFLTKSLLPLIAGILVIGIGTAAIYYKLVKAQVVFLVKPVRVEKELEFTLLSGGTKTDAEKMILPGLEISSEVSGKKTVDVKGKKTIGEKATGEIVIYNGSDKTKTFSKKTVILAADGLRFVLFSDVSVPAKTVDINASPPVEKWGEVKTRAEAVDIGTQYNIGANSVLKLESLPASGSSVLIRNSSAFSGGSSREISAVSKEDRDLLQKSLLAELGAKAETEIKDKISTGFILPGSLGLESKTDQFNFEVGDEADQLSLEQKAVFTAVYFKEEDLAVLTEKTFESLVPEGFDKKFINETKEVILADKKKNLFKAKINRDYYPKIDNQEIARKLVAKPISKTKNIIEGQHFIEGYEVTITPKILSHLKFFPINGKNIIVSLKPI